MARFNEILVGRYNRMMQKLLSMKGPASLVTLSDEMQAVLPLYYGVENRYLEGWERFASNPSQAAVAANFGQIRFRNPVGSNMISVFEKITLINTAGVVDQPGVRIYAQTADLATGKSSQPLDPRGRTGPTLVVTSTAGAAPVSFNLINQIVVAGVGVDYILTDDQELTVLPGQALDVLSNVANQILQGCMVWRERFFEESERT